jgi:hypothetical protein
VGWPSVRHSGLAAAALLTLIACGAAPGSSETSPTGDIPDSQAYVAFTPAAGAYTVKIPEGWSRTASGSNVTFSDRLDSVRIDTQPAGQAPTVESATAGQVPALRGAVPGFSLQDVTGVRRSAGDAVRIRYRADSQPSSVTNRPARLAVERYEFWHAGVEATITLSSPLGADNTDPWRAITDSFAWR